jgi:5-methylcytosine-specific restriction endonuclease McrA
MPRFKIADKKAIAKYQKQEVYETYETDFWTGEERTRLIGYRCKLCRRIFPLDILEVDHIRPLAKGGSSNPANLQLLCPACNKKKGSKIKKTAKKTVAKSLTKKASASRKKTVRTKRKSRKVAK